MNLKEIKTNVVNNFTIPVGCVPRTHRLIGVIACLPVGRGITPYEIVKKSNAFVLVYNLMEKKNERKT
jgi:hypothetical protein